MQIGADYKFINDSLPVNVKSYGAKGDGVTDDTAAITAAIAAASAIVNGQHTRAKVYFPCGRYIVSSILDFTNTRTFANKVRDGITLVGDGMGYSVIVGRTGAGRAIMDVTGSQWLHMSDLTLTTEGRADSSTIGIYAGLAKVLPQTQNQVFHRIAIFMHSDVAANGGNGTVAYYNFGAEENTHNSIYYVANRPLVLTCYANNPFTYQFAKLEQEASHSLGVTTFTGECFLQALGCKHPAIEAIDINSLIAQNLYIHGLPQSGVTVTQYHAIRVKGGFTNCKISGTLEGWPGMIEVQGRVEQCDITYTLGQGSTAGKGILRLVQGEGTINKSTIRAWMNADTDRYFFETSDTGNGEILSCYVKDSTVSANMPLSRMMLPEKVIFNPNTGGTIIQTSDTQTYRVNSGQHIVNVSNKTIRGDNGSTTSGLIGKVRLPTASGSNSASSIQIQVMGIVAHSRYASNGTSSARFTSVLPIVISNTGAATVGAAVNTFSAHIETNANANAITAVSLTGTVVGNTVELYLSPAVSGANNEFVAFTGEIVMHFLGHVCNAPSLIL